MNDPVPASEMSDGQPKLERLRVYANILTVLITVGGGSLGVAVVNHDYQLRQLEQAREQNDATLKLQREKAEADRRQAEMKYLGEYVQYALENDIAKRLRFAEYFAALTISDDLKVRWESYRDHLQALRDQEAGLNEKIAEAAREGQIKKAAELQVELSKLQPSIVQLTPATAADYAATFPLIRTNELKLSRQGEQAFLNGDYDWTIKFLEQALRVESSGVWQSSYPYLIGAYLMINDKAKAVAVADAMVENMTKPSGYLSHDTTQGFVLKALGDVRNRVSPIYTDMIDKLIDRVIAIKSANATK